MANHQHMRQKTKERQGGASRAWAGLDSQATGGATWRLVRVGLIQLRGPRSQTVATWTRRSKNTTRMHTSHEDPEETGFVRYKCKKL